MAVLAAADLLKTGPSHTALRVAQRRAAHQLVDHPKVLDDPLALRIIGPEAASKITSEPSHHFGARSLRAFITVRSRYAEDELARAVESGVRQYVVLGAGLDTFAYRNPYVESGLRVFEVDHPATQAWKRMRISEAAIQIPSELTFVGLDFEKQTLAEALPGAGLHINESAFFSWLGVTPYLSRTAFEETMKFIASLPAPTGVVFDYAVARSALNLVERLAMRALAKRVASSGEPFQLYFVPRELSEELTLMGFQRLEDLGPKEMNTRYFGNRSDGLKVTGGLAHLMSARL